MSGRAGVVFQRGGGGSRGGDQALPLPPASPAQEYHAIQQEAAGGLGLRVGRWGGGTAEQGAAGRSQCSGCYARSCPSPPKAILGMTVARTRMRGSSTKKTMQRWRHNASRTPASLRAHERRRVAERAARRRSAARLPPTPLHDTSPRATGATAPCWGAARLSRAGRDTARPLARHALTRAPRSSTGWSTPLAARQPAPSRWRYAARSGGIGASWGAACTPATLPGGSGSAVETLAMRRRKKKRAWLRGSTRRPRMPLDHRRAQPPSPSPAPSHRSHSRQGCAFTRRASGRAHAQR